MEFGRRNANGSAGRRDRLAGGDPTAGGRPGARSERTQAGRAAAETRVSERVATPDGRPTGEPGDDERLSLGTTIVGIRTPEAVVLASDQRASMGGMVSARNVQKVQPLGEGAATTYTGTVSGAQVVTERVRSERRSYETRRGRRMSTEALASVVGNEIAGLPVPVRALVAGSDADGPALFTFDGGGGRLRQPFAADGSGGRLALGVLEDGHEPELGVAEARSLAVDAVTAASERDTASGNGLCLAVVGDGRVSVDRYDDPAAGRSPS